MRVFKLTVVMSVKDNVARTGKVVWVIRNDDNNIAVREKFVAPAVMFSVIEM